MLEEDKTKYLDMLENQPVVASGNDTVRKYFSFDDTIGNGYLKQRYRQMIGLSEETFVP